MTWREGSFYPAPALGKTRLTFPSCPALFSLGLTVPTSHQTVEAVKGLQPTDTLLPREGNGERGGLHRWGEGVREWPVVPSPLPKSAQFVVLGVMEGMCLSLKGKSPYRLNN